MDIGMLVNNSEFYDGFEDDHEIELLFLESRHLMEKAGMALLVISNNASVHLKKKM